MEVNRENEALITAERIREILDYDPETGVFRWRKSGKGRRGNKVAGSKQSFGYVRIKINGKEFRANRLAWLYVTGRWPENQIDHIYGNKADNRFVNLRQADIFTNSQNQRKPHEDNACGFLGVFKSRDRWRARIHTKGRDIHVGVFDCPEEAHLAYLEAKRKLHMGCTL
jgi:hypothetical protein